MEQKNLTKEFLNKGWGLSGTEQILGSQKLARRQDEATALKAYRISLVFLFCNIHAHTG